MSHLGKPSFNTQRKAKDSMNDTVPGCINYYGAPIPPNNCSTCPERKMCRKNTFESKHRH